MAANNMILVIGRVGRDPEVRTFDSGRAKATFTLAVNRPIKDKNGNHPTDWFNVELWGKSAELAGELVRKGALIAVNGACNIDEWVDREGQKQRMVKVAAEGFQLLESKKDAEARPAGPPDDDYFDDDIPPF